MTDYVIVRTDVRYRYPVAAVFGRFTSHSDACAGLQRLVPAIREKWPEYKIKVLYNEVGVWKFVEDWSKMHVTYEVMAVASDEANFV